MDENARKDTEKKVFYWPIRVYHEDIDSMGIVYYANYLKFLERARTEWLRAANVDQLALHQETGIWLVVRSMTLEYHTSARLDDQLRVSVRIDGRTRTSMTVSQEITAGEKRLLSASVKIVSAKELYSPTGTRILKAAPIPASVLTALEAYL